MATGANCVVVAGQPGRRGAGRRLPGPRRHPRRRQQPGQAALDVRKASFLSMDRAVEESGMEYGGITPVGLPAAGGCWSTRGCSTSTWRSSAPASDARSCCSRAGCWGAPGRRGRGGTGRSRGTGPVNDRGRTRTRTRPPTERADRKWDDMLQELRVMQTGAQLTAGFLLTLPFQQKFADLDRIPARRLPGPRRAGRGHHRAGADPCRRAPAAVRRAREGPAGPRPRHHARPCPRCLALLVAGIVTFIFDVVVDRTSALVVGGALAVLLVALLVVLPRAWSAAA